MEKGKRLIQVNLPRMDVTGVLMVCSERWARAEGCLLRAAIRWRCSILPTLEVYFDVPDKRCTVLLEVDAATYNAFKTMDGLNDMFGCDVRPISKSEYTQLTKQYQGL